MASDGCKNLPYVSMMAILKFYEAEASILWFIGYRKNLKNWDTWNDYHNCPTIGTVGFYSAVLRSKDADRIINRVDPDQTAP